MKKLKLSTFKRTEDVLSLVSKITVRKCGSGGNVCVRRGAIAMWMKGLGGNKEQRWQRTKSHLKVKNNAV